MKMIKTWFSFLIWNLALKYCQKQIERNMETMFEYNKFEIYRERDEQALRVNYPIGTKIIERSNEPGPYGVYTVVGHEYFGFYADRKKLVLSLIDEKGGEAITFADHPWYYHDRLVEILDKLEWWEQWNLYARGLSSISKEESQKQEDRIKERKDNIGNFAYKVSSNQKIETS